MPNALEIARKAISLWRQVHGNESLYMQCQRFDGFYWQWAFQGNENGIHTYGTAKMAANASKMFTHNVNDSAAQPGDLMYWDWSSEGHVGTVIGRQNGRNLVSHTGAGGADTVVNLGNNAKVSHADTIRHPFLGISHTNGANRRRTGLTAWPAPANTPSPTLPQEDDMTIFVRRNKQAKVHAVSVGSGKSRPVGSTEWNAIKRAYGAAGLKLPLIDVNATEAKQFGI